MGEMGVLGKNGYRGEKKWAVARNGLWGEIEACGRSGV